MLKCTPTSYSNRAMQLKKKTVMFSSSYKTAGFVCYVTSQLRPSETFKSFILLVVNWNLNGWTFCTVV